MRVITGAEEDFGRYACLPLPEEDAASLTLPEAVPVEAAPDAQAQTLAELLQGAPMPPATTERPASDDAFAALPEPAFDAGSIPDLRRHWGSSADGDRASGVAGIPLSASSEPAAAAPASIEPAPPASASTPGGYIGETPVHTAWLDQRETALVAVRSDYEAARAQAQADVGTAPGWTTATLGSDESGRVFSLTNAPIAFIEDAPPEVAGYDDGGAPVLQQVGHWVEFDEAAFAASYRAQAAREGTPLQALAAVYQTDAASLFADHPELWRIATSDHALNAGPAFPGQAMGDAGPLRALDFYLADPQISALIDAYGGAPAPAASPIANEQVRLYGERRYGQLSRLAHAMQSVRDQYTGAMAAAAQAGSGVGWVERSRTVSVEAEGMMTRTEDVHETVFDHDTFSAWYLQQAGLQHQAFADFYGAGHFQTFGVGGGEDSPGRMVTTGSFDNADWVFDLDGRMHHSELVGLDPNRPPDLYDDLAVGFDPVIGWATHSSNLEPDNDDDWIFTTFQVAAVAVVAWACYPMAVQAGAAVAGATGGTLAGAVTTGAIMGGVGATVSGFVNGNLTIRNVLRGALVGGVTAGVMNVAGLDGMGMVDGKIVDYAKYTMAITGRATLQGALAELSGSRFKDGFISGFSAGVAQGLAAQICAGISADIQALEGLTSAERSTLQLLTRILGSSIRALASPEDPLNAFASDVINSMLGAAGSTAEQTTSTAPQIAFDDDGHLMPGAVDTTLPIEQQAAQLLAQLRAQGLSAEEAGLLVYEAVWQGSPQPVAPPSAASPSWTPQELQARVDEVERRLDQDLRAQQAREDSLLTADELLTDTGGSNPPHVVQPVVPVLNRGFDAALNAVSDVAGILAPMQELRGSLAKLEATQAERQLDGMREVMRKAGVSGVPEGFAQALDANGNSVRDYGATLERLKLAYEGFVRDQRLRANWGDNYQSLRIGRSQMTVQQFEAKTLEVQQKEANAAYQRGVEAIAKGDLPLKNGDYILTLGTYMDGQVRAQLRRFGALEGMPDSSVSNVFAVNRQIRGGGMIGIPDLRLGTSLMSDVTLSRKNGNTDQLRRWNEIRANDTIIIRPEQLGGSYIVPRASIRPVVTPRGGG